MLHLGTDKVEHLVVPVCQCFVLQLPAEVKHQLVLVGVNRQPGNSAQPLVSQFQIGAAIGVEQLFSSNVSFIGLYLRIKKGPAFKICAVIFPPLIHSAMVFSVTSSCTVAHLPSRCIRGGLPRLQAVRYRPEPSETSCGTGAADSHTPICGGGACRDGHCPFPDAGASFVQRNYP